MSGQSSAFVGSIPEWYDTGLGPMIFTDYADDLARRAAAAAPQRVLETAAGTGIVTRKLRDRIGAGATLTATDLNPPMLDVARKKFEPGERVEFQPSDATALPFPDAAFDAVVCQFGVMFFPDKEKSYREAHRVLARKGRYLFNVWDAHRYNAFARITHETVGRFFPADPPAFYRVPFSYGQIDPIKEALIAAGFGRIRADVVAVEKRIPQAAMFARGLVYGNPVIDQIRARGGIEPERILEAVTGALKAEFGADPGAMRLQAIVFEAAKI
ncbi:MAG TPA: methyltransferase domain-containing protein [Alphaproteobacteria bacterium]|jgi:ubiquinone/menaquinone biosynthesis C-methylase UbiE